MAPRRNLINIIFKKNFQKSQKFHERCKRVQAVLKKNASEVSMYTIATVLAEDGMSCAKAIQVIKEYDESFKSKQKEEACDSDSALSESPPPPPMSPQPSPKEAKAPATVPTGFGLERGTNYHDQWAHFVQDVVKKTVPQMLNEAVPQIVAETVKEMAKKKHK